MNKLRVAVLVLSAVMSTAACVTSTEPPTATTGPPDGLSTSAASSTLHAADETTTTSTTLYVDTTTATATALPTATTGPPDGLSTSAASSTLHAADETTITSTTLYVDTTTATATALPTATTGPPDGLSTSAASSTLHAADETTITSTTLYVDTTTATATALPPVRSRETLIIHGIGDVALDPVYIPTFPSEGYGYAWSGLGGIFQRDDLTVINMECAVSDLGNPVPKAFNFRCDPAALPSALEAGVDVANLANNHTLDFGREALVDSVVNLRAAGIHPVGAGSNYEEAYTPALLEVRGWKIAVLGFGGVLDTRAWLATEDRPGIASGDDRADMVAAVERAAEIADLVIVTIHWGRQLDTQPRPDDIAHAEAMVAAGADIIFGHHQHRVGPLGEIDGKPVAWGLGHIVWRRINPVSAQTTVAKVVVHPDGTMGACLMPAEIVRHGHPVFVGDTPGYCELLYGGRPSPMEPPSVMF